MEGDRRVLRIGAAGGVLGAVFVLAAALISLTLLPTSATTAEFLAEYGQRAVTYAFVSVLFLAGLLIASTLFLAFHRTLKETNPDYALAGLLFYVVGVALIGASVGTFVVYPRNAADYAAGTDVEKTTIIAAARATGRVLAQVNLIGSLFVGLSGLSFGAVMFANRNFGRLYGGLSVLFVALGIVVVSLSFVLPVSAVPNVLVAVYLFVFGWRVFVLSKGT